MKDAHGYTFKMNKYGQYCPVARAVEILGDRWTLLIIRDLVGGSRRFSELEHGLPGIPKALLTERLNRLQEENVVERLRMPDQRSNRYALTQGGWELAPMIEMLTQWGARWAFGDPRESELNPLLLLWWMHDRVIRAELPAQRVVLEFDFLEVRPARYWLVLQTEDVSVCIQHPGYEIDLLVTAGLADFFQVWLGRVSFGDALRQQQIELDGLPAFIRGFPKWFALSPIAGIVRATAPARSVQAQP